MTKEIWLNLPVKDVEKTKSFFTEIGFNVNEHAPKSPTMASFKFGQKTS